MKDCKARMCKHYLLANNLQVPNALKEKKVAVLKDKKSMMNDTNEYNNASVQPSICSLHKLITNEMTAVDSKNQS